MKKVLEALFELSSWLVASVISGFLLAPVETTTWTKLAAFVLAIGIGVAIVIVTNKLKGQFMVWAIAAVAFLTGALGVYARYENISKHWTGECRGKSFIMGSEYTPAALKYYEMIRKTPDWDPCIIVEFEGDPDKVWTRDSRIDRMSKLGWLYLADATLFGLAATGIAAAGRSGHAKTSRRKKKGIA